MNALLLSYQTEEEDMRTTRNQGYIALLQRNKENKDYLIYKKVEHIVIRKNKHNQQIHSVFSYTSKNIFALWIVARHARQKLQWENLRNKDCEKNSIKRIQK